MRIHKSETVVRYHVSFMPHEAKELDQHPIWKQKIHVRPGPAGRYSRGADAMLTKSDINGVCDALGINGREFMARYERRAAQAVRLDLTPEPCECHGNPWCEDDK